MRFYALNQGQAGDLVINTVAARLFKKVLPNDTLIMNVNKRYIDLVPLFLNHPHIDGVHIWDGYDKFSEIDMKWKNSLRDGVIMNPMPPHSRNDWYLHYHQAEECCYQNGLLITDLLNGDFSCHLNPWFDIPHFSKHIAFAPFAGFYNKGNKKKLTTENAQKIANMIVDMGYVPLQIGGPDEPLLDGCELPLDKTFFGSVKYMLGCKALITTDTFTSWAASAYKFPTLGLYSNEYYGKEYVKNIQPINPLALYLDNVNVNDISLDLIRETLKLLL